MKSKIIFAAIAASSAAFAAADANSPFVQTKSEDAPFVGAVTAAADSNYYVLVGKSNVPFGPHKSGRAGIGSSNTIFTGASGKVDFQALTGSEKVTSVSDKGITVYQLENPILKKSEWYEFHRNIGNFNFIQIGSNDIWVGEWSKNSGADKNIRQAYYIGDHTDAKVPQNGIAKYNAYGVNQFNGHNLMQGEITANFGTGKLNGQLENGTKTLKLNNVTIHASTASFSGGGGTASMSGIGGTVQGHFYGKDAAALAGVAEFGTRKDLNTAFGGSKK